jgi:hypothetical protein
MQAILYPYATRWRPGIEARDASMDAAAHIRCALAQRTVI